MYRYRREYFRFGYIFITRVTVTDGSTKLSVLMNPDSGMTVYLHPHGLKSSLTFGDKLLGHQYEFIF